MPSAIPTPPTPGGQAPGGNTSSGLSILQDLQALGTIATPQGASDAGLPLLTGSPPALQLQTFIYSPSVRVVIAASDGLQYDVSADLVRCQLHRAESEAATFWMTLANPDSRYTIPVGGTKPRFSRMDRIAVFMTRINEVQVFSGYLDTVPYFQMYPGEVQFKATCTLKRLMHVWWNPSLDTSQALLNSSLWAQAVAGDNQPGAQKDSGLGGLLRGLMTLVGGWLVANIHIQNFPTTLFQYIQAQVNANQSINAAAVQKFDSFMLGSQAGSAVPGAAAGYNANAGAPGPTAPSVTGGAGPAGASAPGVVGGNTQFYISQIIKACDAAGQGPSVNDNNQSAALNQVGQTMENSSPGPFGSNTSNQKAGQQLSSSATQAQLANRQSDGAILATAIAAVETGGGAAIRNLYNPNVPGSQQCPNDGEGHDTNAVGIFQQEPEADYGTVQERMNPLQAATMFFQQLAVRCPGWRNMDYGQAACAIQGPLNNADYAAKVDAAYPWATAQVQAQRTAGTTITAAASGIGAGGSISVGAPAPSGNASLTVGAPSVSPGGVAAAATGRPVPDSEGAINFARAQIGKPYVWGATGPDSYDCSGLVMMAFKSIGVQVPRNTVDMVNQLPAVAPAAIQRGDLVFPNGNDHVILWLNDGTIIESPEPGYTVHQRSAYCTPQSAAYIRRACPNGGPDPAAPYGNPFTNGPGQPPGGMAQAGGGTSPGSSGSSSDDIGMNLFAYIFTQGFSADAVNCYPSEKSFIDGQPLIQMIRTVCAAGLRQFQSCPNGDFMAYYPDYWGIDGKPAVLSLRDIELKDVRIDLSDDPLTTHVYVDGDLSKTGATDQERGWLDTAGVATVEDTWLWQRLVKVAPGSFDVDNGKAIMDKYGIRPLAQTFAMAGSYELELLLAAEIFMEKWAQQYQTSISMTFMPELYPGMRVLLESKNLSVYVTEVTHSCDYVAGFFTTATIMAPANPNGASLMQTVTAPLSTFQNSDAFRAIPDPTSSAATPGTTSPVGGGG